MADFSHLKQLDVKECTAEYTFHQITVNGVSPTLIIKPATEANKPYFNALLKRAGKTARRVKSGNINSSVVEENRDEDKGLYPKHVVVGWYDTMDVNGADVPFGVEDCTKFLAQLPNWLFDALRDYAADPANFVDVIDVEINSKN